MSAAEYRALAHQAMQPKPGFQQPSQQQIDAADVWAKLAISASISEATTTDMDPSTTIHPAVHHTA